MKSMLSVLGLTLLTCTVAWGQPRAPIAEAELQNAQGEPAGIVTFIEGRRGVTMIGRVYNMKPGFHVFHIHDTGTCTPPDFQSAGGHFNPQVGNMPNLFVGLDGTGTILTNAPHVTLDGGEQSLFHPGGTSIIIHALADDARTESDGDAGERVACGPIDKTRNEERTALRR